MHGAMPDDPTDDSAPHKARVVRLWRRWGWVVRWTGALLGVLYVYTLIDLDSLRAALVTVPVAVVLAAVALTALSQVIGAVRWRTLFRAYGAQTRPALATAVRLSFVAVFYNAYLPGAVAGDVVRAVVTRSSFENHGTTGALAVVFVERALGMFALFAMVFAGVALSGDALGIGPSLQTGSVIGAAAALAATLALALGRRLARFFPRPLARLARRIPQVVRPGAFAAAMALSICTQATLVISGWLVLRALHSGTTLIDALLVVPTGVAAAMLPISAGGIGPREAAFVWLAGRVLGMPSEEAVAASLMHWLSIMIVGGIGGVLVMIGRRGARVAPVPEPMD
jgi:glycosyltransferase 2 family protein